MSSNQDGKAEGPGAGSLQDRVAEWLNKEGFPTEFRTANTFRKHKFHVQQGSYVRDKAGQTREVDVVASMTARPRDDYFLRISHLIECKWSKDKPWVIFTSPTTHLAPSACVAQTIGSVLGDSIVWTMAGDKQLHEMELFATPSEGGFGGRQAFSKGNDHFYSAVQAVVSNCSLYAEAYDKRHRTPGSLPRAGVLAFPVVAVEGEIFRAYFDADIDDIKLESVDHVRCHWRGASSWIFHATVDIVTMRHLDSFVEKRAQETLALLTAMGTVADSIADCCSRSSLSSLNVTQGPRGIVGLPDLLREIALLDAGAPLSSLQTTESPQRDRHSR